MCASVRKEETGMVCLRVCACVFMFVCHLPVKKAGIATMTFALCPVPPTITVPVLLLSTWKTMNREERRGGEKKKSG